MRCIGNFSWSSKTASRLFSWYSQDIPTSDRDQWQAALPRLAWAKHHVGVRSSDLSPFSDPSVVSACTKPECQAARLCRRRRVQFDLKGCRYHDDRAYSPGYGDGGVRGKYGERSTLSVLPDELRNPPDNRRTRNSGARGVQRRRVPEGASFDTQNYQSMVRMERNSRAILIFDRVAFHAGL